MPSTASQKGTLAFALPPAGDSGVYQTSPGLLRRRALGPWAEGLAQYLAIRLGDAARGRAAYRSLLRMLASLPPQELVEPPGPKAQLYRLARSLAETERAMPGGRSEGGALPWREASGRRGRALRRLREQLSPRQAELLELRHARELGVEEIACVLETPADEVELALDTTEARARQLLGEHAPDPLSEHAPAYVEAFALEPDWQGADASAPEDDGEAEAGLEPGTLIGGRYELVERVGVGAFGDVYRAEDVEVPGHQVALKLLRQPSLSESARRAALRELKLNAAVFHPSLVQFKDHGWFEQRLWFVMPWYEGETLEARMRRGPLSRAEARRIFEPLARALAALHEAGIRHQDIKPENVLLTRLPGYGVDAEGGGVLPVLIDLGVAAEEQETLLGGTPLYFAPEVAERFVAEGHVGPDVDGRADVFALALSLRNALEPGTQPDVPAGAIQAFVERRAKERPPLPEARELRYLRTTFERWLSVDPDDRPTAEQLAEELAVLTAPEERRARRNKVLRWLLPLLAMVATAFVLVVYVLEQRAAREEREAREARMAAADARADLIVADARRQALEQGHAELLARYEQSRMSRRELAGQLATAEGQLRILRGELATALDARAGLRDRLAATRQRLVETREALAGVESTLGETREQRDEARGRAERLAGELGRSRSEAARVRDELAAAQARVEALSGELADARRATEAQRARAEQLDARLAEAVEARARAERDLERVRAHVARLADALRPAEPEPENAEAPPADAPASGEPAPPSETTAL
jgi:predicted  nucleic acid-binding Zn-ribbon protein